MIAVIFEVEPRDGHEKDYFERAANLRPLLEKMDGFISVERFRSLANENRYLSLSFWRDEASFADYRLRIAAVMRDYGLRARDEAPSDARVYHHA